MQKLRLLIGVIVPVATYVVLAATLHSDLVALAVTEAIPIVWILAVGLRQGRVDPLAAAVAVVLAIAVLVSLAAGGSSLPLKLRRAALTGSFGIACLVSVAVRRPLLPIAMRWLARGWPRAQRLVNVFGGAGRSDSAVLTLIVGITLLSDAVAQVTLALSLSTAAFLGASRLARIAIVVTGLTVCGIYLRRPASPRTLGTQQ